MIENYAQAISAARSGESYFFDEKTMRFFNSRILKTTFSPIDGGGYFITSERYDSESPRLYTIRFISDEGRVETIGDFQRYETAKKAKSALKALVTDTTKYRWIVYLHQPLGGFEVVRVPSLTEAKKALYGYSRDTFIYEEASATLYPYSKEDWEEALEYQEIGCPFDYPSKMMEFGPKGGIKVANA